MSKTAAIGGEERGGGWAVRVGLAGVEDGVLVGLRVSVGLGAANVAVRVREGEGVSVGVPEGARLGMRVSVALSLWEAVGED